MAIDLQLATADVLGLRFARSPMWETMEALRTVRYGANDFAVRFAAARSQTAS